jgi:hypothetical protein
VQTSIVLFADVLRVAVFGVPGGPTPKATRRRLQQISRQNLDPPRLSQAHRNTPHASDLAQAVAMFGHVKAQSKYMWERCAGWGSNFV